MLHATDCGRDHPAVMLDPLESFQSWRCAHCGEVIIYAPRCLCGADLPAEVGGDVELIPCDACASSGYVEVANVGIPFVTPCPACNGQGWTNRA